MALAPALSARADDRVVCQKGATVTGRFVRNASRFPVRVSVILPGVPAYTMTETISLPPGAKCPVSVAVTFLADASTDNAKSYHRVMSRTLGQPDGTWLLEVAPDSFNGNFDYSAQFSIRIKP
jgi:hypothetical protein